MKNQKSKFLAPLRLSALVPAFTLAEVLITLAIIGVVAALTIPTLTKNYQKKQYLVKFQKAYSTISNAVKMYPASMGCDTMVCAGVLGIFPDASYTYITIANKVKEFANSSFKIVKSCSAEEEPCIENWQRSNLNLKDELKSDLSIGGFFCEGALSTGDNARCYVFQTVDGMIYKIESGASGHTSDNGGYDFIDTYHITVDINGEAGPNRYGHDTFIFVFGKDGRVAPKYSAAANKLYPSYASDGKTWKDDPTLCGTPGSKVSMVNIGWSDLQGENANESLITLFNNAVSGEGCAARIIDEGFKITYF